MAHAEVSPVPGTHHIWSRLSKRLCGALLAALLLNGPATAADGAGARAVVEGLNAALLESMRSARELGYDGRHQLLEPVLRRSFDFPFMARIAVGRAWTDFSAAERAQIVDLFAEMSIANFAARFDGFSGERFEVVDERAGPRDAVVIESRIVRPDDGPVGLHYVLREFEDGWRIIDVLLDAKYSELARQKAEFGAVLRDGGVADLMALLQDKIADLEAEARS
jgi:phospholipid transport system substrate-binding protein